MQIVRSVVVAGSPARVAPLVDDLAAYPAWMALVHDVTTLPDDDGRACWDVELQAQVGPLTRSKRLRMARTVHRPDDRFVFERSEVDGRSHSPWVLEVSLERASPSDDGGEESTSVVMQLTYGGSLWTGAVLQRVLDEHVERGARALQDRCRHSDIAE